MRVVVVEDDAAMRGELSRTVEALSGKVVLAEASSQPAIEWLANNPEGWDLAIVDVFLKQGHGFDVVRRCRKALPHQRVVMLSNYVREGIAHYARAAGADRFFDKSFELADLVSYCRQLAAGRTLAAD